MRKQTFYLWIKSCGDVIFLDRKKFMRFWYSNIDPRNKNKTTKKLLISIKEYEIYINDGTVTYMSGNKAKGFITLFSAFDEINRSKLKEYALSLFQDIIKREKI